MSAQANIVAFDGAATPVSHTLVPMGVAMEKTGDLTAYWCEKLASVPEAGAVKFKQTKRKLPSGITRVTTVTEVPVMESVSGVNAAGYTAAPKVAYTNTMITIGLFSERATPAERKLARQLALNINGSVSTSVAPVVTGPVPELIDLNIQAS